MAKNRPDRGILINAIIKDYTVIDVETTGLNDNDEIIEISAIRIRDNLIDDYFSSLVQPHKKISEFIENLTGITNEDLYDAPSAETVIPQALDFIGEDIVIAHNAPFDIGFIYDASMAVAGVPFKNNFADTLSLSRAYYPDAPDHKLGTLINYLGIDAHPSHRSLADCQATYMLYVKMTDPDNKTVFPNTQSKVSTKYEIIPTISHKLQVFIYVYLGFSIFVSIFMREKFMTSFLSSTVWFTVIWYVLSKKDPENFASFLDKPYGSKRGLLTFALILIVLWLLAKTR